MADIDGLLAKYNISVPSGGPVGSPPGSTLEMSAEPPAPAAAAAPTQEEEPRAPPSGIDGLMQKYGIAPPAATQPPPPPAPAEQPAPKPEDDGFWSITGKSMLRGLLTGGQEAKAGLQVAAGMPLGMAAQELPPEHQDEVNTLLKQGVSEGWSNPKWWGAQIGYGASSAAPSIATGLAGAGLGSLAGPVGTLVGGGAGFGIGSAVQTIVPAFARAKAAGLDDDRALSQALQETGITAAFSSAMGMAPGMSVFGRTTENMLKRPIAEALTQMGVIQPAIGLAQQTAVAATQGRTITPDEALTGYVTMLGVGGTYTGLHMAGASLLRPRAPEAPVPTIEPQAVLAGQPADPMWRIRSRDIISEKGPNSADGGQWLATLRNAGVKDEELDALRIPLYLQDANGKISKSDLISHIEENQIKINDIVEEWDSHKDAVYGAQTLPGPKDKYIQIRMQLDRGPLEPELPPDWLIERVHPGEWQVYNSEGRSVGDSSKNRNEAIRNAMLSVQEGDPRAEGRRPEDFGTPRYVDVHYEEPDLIMTGRATARIDRDGRRTLLIEELQPVWHQAFREQQEAAEKLRRSGFEPTKEELSIPEPPFKTSVHELGFKRMLHYAAANGYERIAWTNGEQQIARYRGLDERQQRGMREFYGSPGDLSSGAAPQRGILDNVASRWGKRLGMESGQTTVANFEDLRRNIGGFRTTVQGGSALMPVRYLDVNPAASERIRMGLPMWSLKPGEVRLTEADAIKRGPSIDEMVRGFNREDTMVRARRPLALEAAGAIQSLLKAMKIRVPLEIHIQPTLSHEGLPARGLFWADSKSYHIALALEAHATREEFFATAAHEFGHLLMVTRFDDAHPLQQSAILSAYEKWLRENPPSREFNRIIAQRDNAITSFYDRANFLGESRPLLSMTPERQRYWTSFEEWFAEQTARWATTSQKPLSIVDRFFSGLGKSIRDVVDRFRQMVGGAISPDPHVVMQKWLDSHITSGPWAADIVGKFQFRTKQAAQSALERDGTPDAGAEPLTASTVPGRTIMASLFSRGDRPPRADADAAHADRINKVYELMLSMPQMVKLNPDNRAAQYYKETVQTLDAAIKSDGSDSMTILGGIRRLGQKQEEAMWKAAIDYGTMQHLTPDERAQGNLRKPNAAELDAIFKKHGVDDRGRTAFGAVVKRFDQWLDRYEKLMNAEAMRIRDPVQQADKLASVQAMMAEMRKTPFMPFMRFGDYGLVVKDAAGNILHYESHDTPRKQRAAQEVLANKLNPGETIEPKFVSKDAAPFRGIPAGLIDMIADKMQLSDSQRFALDELRFEGGPARGFRGRFRELSSQTTGFSTDMRRAFANFEFHAASYFNKLGYIDQLRGFVKQMKDEAVQLGKVDLAKGQKRDQFANFLADHLKYYMDPKGDFGKLRALAFHWYLGFSPAAALLNLSQTILMTYPFLAQHFGDARAIGAMMRASTSLSTYYRKGTLLNAPATQAELRAMGELVREGTLTEALAPQLAATAENRNLSEGFGGDARERAMNTFNQWSSFFFEHTEQTNRRIAARAAFNLAMDHPDSPYVRRMVEANPLQYQRLLDRGIPPNEAAAITAAKDVVESTQFIYGQYARPKFMRGKLGSLFVFKSFTQNTLFNLWNYPGAAVRTLLLMGALGGLLNMPGVEDINGILRGIAFRIFGKDFDLQDQARDLVTRMFGGKGEKVTHPSQILTDQGHIRPDILLHGLSRVGYGIPAVLDMLGNVAGYDHVPFPVSDRHQNIGMGNILPVEPGILLAPEVTGMGAGVGQGNVSNQALRETQRASGAIFGLGFAIYRAVMNSQLSATDFRRYEQLLPSAFRNAAQAYRYYRDEAATSQRGAATIRFDPHDTEHMAEILAKAMGYQPQRLTAQYDRITAEREAIAYWDIRKQMLLRQAWAARNTNDPDTYSRAIGAIKKYNQELPEEARAKAITSDVLLKSFQTSALAKAKQEAGIPLATQNVPLSRAIQQMYPEAQIGAGRRVQ